MKTNFSNYGFVPLRRLALPQSLGRGDRHNSRCRQKGMVIIMKKTIGILLSSLLIAGILTSCGLGATGGSSSQPSSGPAPSGGEPGGETAAPIESNTFPIVEEPITINMGRTTFLGRFENISEMWKTKDYEEMTGIHVNIKEYPETGWQESIQLELATGNVQDAYYQIEFSSEQMYEYSQSGLIIPLDEMIAQYAPNLRHILDENPSFRKALQMPDGHIYSLPFIERDILTGSSRTYLNQLLMEQAGIAEIPSTIAGLDEYLAAVKTLKPDMYPISMPKGNMENILQNLMGAYGIGTTGLKGIRSFVDLGPDGAVRFIPTSDGYKALIGQMADWYRAGYINPESFTTIDVPQMRNLGQDDNVAMFAWAASNLISTDQEIRNHWTAVFQFEGPQGDRMVSAVDAPIRQSTAFLITSKNPYPVETLRWVDYFYGEEGYLYQLVGREGESYAMGDDGKYAYIGEAKDFFDKGEISYYIGNHGAGFPLHNNSPEYSDKTNKVNADLRTDGRPAWQRYQIQEDDDYMSILPADIWPDFIATDEEADEISVILSEIKTYIGEMQDRFITGATSVEEEWDNYVNTLNRLGADKYLEIKQAQYERYSAN